MGGPNPMENLRTRTPHSLATAKCPNSWTVITTPRITTNREEELRDPGQLGDHARASRGPGSRSRARATRPGIGLEHVGQVAQPVVSAGRQEGVQHGAVGRGDLRERNRAVQEGLRPTPRWRRSPPPARPRPRAGRPVGHLQVGEARHVRAPRNRAGPGRPGRAAAAPGAGARGGPAPGRWGRACPAAPAGPAPSRPRTPPGSARWTGDAPPRPPARAAFRRASAPRSPRGPCS